MAKIPSICIIAAILTIIPQWSVALYEDQVGKFDWKRSFVGEVNNAAFDANRVIITTKENVLASLHLKSGQIIWRQLLEDPTDHQVQFLQVANGRIVSISGNKHTWFIRQWEASSGVIQSEWSLALDNDVNCKWLMLGEDVVQVFGGDRLEVVGAAVKNGGEKWSWGVNGGWGGEDCVISGKIYVCAGSQGLKWVDLGVKGGLVGGKSLEGFTGGLQVVALDGEPQGVLVSSGGVTGKVVYLDGSTGEGPVLMGNAVGLKDVDGYIFYQLEANVDNPKKLIVVKSISQTSGKVIESIEIEYPVGLGAPYIVAGQCKMTVCDLLLSSTDNAVSLVRLPEGKILWSRDEALSHLVATEFLELPVSELDASIETEFETASDIISMLTHRLNSQIKQFSNLIFGGQLLNNNALVRDDFGLHKIIVVATRAGKLFGIDTLTGSTVWSYRLPNIKPFSFLTNQLMLLFVQRTARYAPALPAQCLLLAEDSITGNGVLFQFDPITGFASNSQGIIRLPYKIKQATLLPQEDKNYMKTVLIYSEQGDVHLYPNEPMPSLTNNYLYTVDAKTMELSGYAFIESKPIKTWHLNLGPAQLLALSTKPTNERVHSQGRVLPDRSVYYKYINPNLIALATLTEDQIHKHVLSVYLIDGVTGLVVYANCHKRAKGPVNLIHSENWLVYSFFNERFRRTEIVSAELYEGYVQSNSTVFSSHAVSQLPHVQTQAYIIPVNPTHIAVTLTERGITNKFLLMALSTGGVTEIPWLLLQPRFENIACGPEESCIPYMPEIPIIPESLINYNQTLGRVRGIQVAPARLESTSHVLVHGLDLFYTRVAPSKSFDVLKEDFDYNLILFVLLGLVVASYITKHLASQKALKQIWK